MDLHDHVAVLAERLGSDKVLNDPEAKMVVKHRRRRAIIDDYCDTNKVNRAHLMIAWEMTAADTIKA